MSDDAVVVGVVTAMVEAINNVDFGKALSAFAQDATVVEDIAPFRWQGQSAPSDWLEAMEANAAKLNISAIVMKLGDVERVEVEAGRAYVVVTGSLRLRSADSELRSDGLLTLTLSQQELGWLISTLTWSGPRPMPPE